MKEHWQFVPIFLWLVGVMGGHSSVLAQTEPKLNGPRAMLRLASVPRKLAAATPVAADTGAFPLAYCTALPSLVFGEWEKDYAKYERFLTPEIRKTQLGMGYTVGKVQTWWCRPSASPHAQLDTLTRLADPTKLEGKWKSILVRTVIHRDSAVFSESKFGGGLKQDEN